jgi:uncharacterized protein with PIN domain
MASITDFMCIDKVGNVVHADAFGNNIAFACPECSDPVLAIAREHFRGSSADKPSSCRGCGTKFWIEVIPEEKLIKLRY